jgi:hypothetical protein
MFHREPGPRRAKSIYSYLWETRALAAAAVLALSLGILADVSKSSFWADHTLLANLVASLIVVMLTVAVVNEVIEWRGRRRWSVLAQYVMIQLVRYARMVWMSIAELAGIQPLNADSGPSVDALARVVLDTDQVTKAIWELVGDNGQRRDMQDRIARLVEQSDEVLGRWAGLFLDTAAYAELLDRHVELASRLAWLQGLLDSYEPPDDRNRQNRAQAHPAKQFEEVLDEEVLIERLVAIAQLAVDLDRSTLEVAGRLVPRAWWSSRTNVLQEEA